MDIYCPKCAEPCDQDDLHHIAGMTYTQAARTFRQQGCGMLFNATPCRSTDPDDADRLAVLAELAELLGDDIDGYAAMCEDLDLLGYPSSRPASTDPDRDTPDTPEEIPA